MKYFYCDSCFLISAYQENFLDALSQYKSQFFTSNTQANSELLYPKALKEKVKLVVTIIELDREEIKIETENLKQKHKSLSTFDCLSLAYALLDGYILVTDDIHLIKAAGTYDVKTKTCAEISEDFNLKKGNI